MAIKTISKHPVDIIKLKTLIESEVSGIKVISIKPLSTNEVQVSFLQTNGIEPSLEQIDLVEDITQNYVDFQQRRVLIESIPLLDKHGANKEYVDIAVADLIDGAPGLLDTLNELAAALNDDENFATTITNRLINIENDIDALTLNDISGTLSISKGGTGQSSAQSAINALTQVSTATNGYVLTKDTATGNATWKVIPVSSAVTTLNGLTSSSQSFATGTTGSDFNISSSSSTHTFNIPDASATARGLITTGTQTIAGAKTFSSTITGSISTSNINFNTTSLISPFVLTRFGNDATPGIAIKLQKNRNGSVGNNTIVQNGDELGLISWAGANGTDYTNAAAIQAFVDGIPGPVNDMPGGLAFFTTPNGSGTLMERLRITNTGNVGIGTSSPTAKLTINHSDTTDALRITQTGTGNALVVEDSTNPDATPFVVAANGNVGIGTSSPTEKLDVVGKIKVSSNVLLQRTFADYNVLSIHNINDDGTSALELHLNANASDHANLRTVTNHALSFSTNNTERLRITNTGNVGIGTSSPTEKLDVVGNAQFSGQIFAPSIELVSALGTSPTFIDFKSSLLEDFDCRIIQGVDPLVSGYAYNGLSFFTGGNGQSHEKLRITNTGNVGIGIISPQNRLHIREDVDGTSTGLYIQNIDQILSLESYHLAGDGQYSTIEAMSSSTMQGHPNIPLILQLGGGKVGIGTSSPTEKLDVVGNLKISNSGSKIIGNFSDAIISNRNYLQTSVLNGVTDVGILPNGTSVVSQVTSYNNSTPTNASTIALLINNTDSFLIASRTGTGALLPLSMFVGGEARIKIETNGNIRLNSGIPNTSSAGNLFVDINEGYIIKKTSSSLKYKTNIENYNKGLSELNSIRPVTFKGINDGDKIFAGFIAEEINQIGLTEYVQYDANGEPDALMYSNMVALLVKAIQELSQKVEELETKLNNTNQE